MKTHIHYSGDEQKIEKALFTKNIVVIADANTNGFCLFVASKLIPAIGNAHLIIIPAGEENKSLTVVEYIWHQMLSIGINKSWIIINIGGGVVCDMGGFASGSYMRGIPFINIPTTLLAMNDASFGGKTGFNFKELKNNIGLITHPIITYINPIFLNTLSDKHIANGAVESIKHALIFDENLWINYLTNNEIIDFTKLDNIKKSIAIKQHFVTIDEYDNNERQALNFGHSVGHAIEAAQLHTTNKLLHGEAVLLGMLVELKISEMIYGTNKNTRLQLMALQQKFYPNIMRWIDKKLVIEKILFDKKNTTFINMSLLKNIAQPAIKTKVSIEQIMEALDIL